MKNALKYYYGLEVSNIHQKNEVFYFKYDNYEYIFTKYDGNDIEKIYNLSSDLNQKRIYCHQIIMNNQNNILTTVNNANYVLLRIFVPKKQLNINDIITFNNIGYLEKETLKLDDWYNLWTNKVDYLEYQISQIGKKYPLIRKSFSYYIGLAENAISLIKNTPNNFLYYSLSHKRISCKDNLQDLYNPLNFVIDLRVRDICEYFKSSFFNKKEIEQQIILYLNYNKLSPSEGSYFFARMLFPTYYFDVYEKIINNEIDEIKINNITTLATSYEALLKKIYQILKNNSNIPNLEWLTN